MGEVFGLLGMFLVSCIKSGVFAQHNPALAGGCVEGTRVQYSWHVAVSWLFI